MHAKKDEANLPFVSHNVANTPDMEEWKSARTGIIAAFLPMTELAERVEQIDADAVSLVAAMNARGPVVDIKDGELVQYVHCIQIVTIVFAELHHAAFSIYLHSLLGTLQV